MKNNCLVNVTTVANLGNIIEFEDIKPHSNSSFENKLNLVNECPYIIIIVIVCIIDNIFY